jgi:hypothetical protein
MSAHDAAVNTGKPDPEDPPVLSLDGARYYARVYFVAGDSCDFFGAVWRARDVEDEPWRISYRYRYYRIDPKTGLDSHPLTDLDRKSTYRWVMPAHLQKSQVLAVMRAAIAESTGADTAFGLGARPEELHLETCDVDVIMTALAAKRWAHLTEATS